VFSYNPGAAAGDHKNPILMTGDVVRVNNSALSATMEVLNDVSRPVVGIYSIYSLFK
jgi:polysaccharide export outer membrane protein